MLILNANAVKQSLPMKEAIEGMKQAFAALSEGKVTAPPRTHLAIERHQGISLFMPAYVDDERFDHQALTIKAVSLFAGNQARGLARIQAAVLVLQPDTGQPIAVLEGASITAIRTAAASGAATDLLARPDSRRLAILGAGVQARSHLAAICCVRPIDSVAVYARTPASVTTLIEEVVAAGVFQGQIRAASTAADAVADADIVCATTTASEPIFDDGDLPAGVHLNAVGSYTPEAREVPPETVVRAKLVVDSREAAWEEAGDLIQPWQAGLILQSDIHAELGELVNGRRQGRESDNEITFFKSVGVSVQDSFAAHVALRNARQHGFGQQVDW